MQGAITFPCSFCGAPVTGVPGASMECPYCHARLAGGPMPPAAMPGASDRAVAPARPAGAFSGGPRSVAFAADQELGFLAIGAHSPVGEPPRLRAWDLAGKRVLWETLQGQTWLQDLRSASLRTIGRNVYVANKRQLLVLDLASGARKWGAPLPDAVDGADEPGGGLGVADPFPPVGRGAVLVRTIDNTLASFDRDTGQPLWTRTFEKKIALDPVVGTGACVVRYGFPFMKVEIVNPAYPQPIAALGHDHWSTDLGLTRVAGRSVVTVAEDMGSGGNEDGLLGFDAVTGARLFFDEINDLDDDVVPCAMGSLVYAAAKKGIYIGPRGRMAPSPIPGHEPVAFRPAGPTLGVLLKKSQGTPVRRVVGLDPATLGFRFDAGEAGTEPDDDWDEQLASDGYSLVFVATPDDDEDRCELRSVDTTTGRMLWSRPVGRWRAHRFLAGALVVFADDRIEVLAPPTGQVVAAMARGSAS